MGGVAYVTGIAGFVGSRLAKALVADGWEVYGCDNLLTGNEDDIPDGVVAWQREDIRGLFSNDIKGLITQYINPDVVFHTAAIARSAWPDEAEVFSVNVDGTKRILDVFPDAKIIYSSSSMSGVPSANTYAFSKYRGEQLVIERGGTALRYSNIYGKGQSEKGAEPNVLMAWKLQSAEQGWIRVDGDGDQVRDFIHVDDVVRANILAADARENGLVLDICTGQSTSILDIAKLLDVPIKFAPRRKNDPLEIFQSTQMAYTKILFMAEKPFNAEAIREAIS